MRFRIEAGATLWLALAVVITLLLVPLPVESAARRWPALTQELKNLGHPLAFSLLASLAFRLLRTRYRYPSRAPYWLVLGGAMILGLATEALQQVVGRDSAWIDLFNDMLGAGFSLLLFARKELQEWRHSRGTGVAIAATVVTMAATGPFLWTLAAYVHRAQQMPVLWRADSALFSPFSDWRENGTASLNVGEPSADWSDRSVLALDLINLHDTPLVIVVRVHDLPHELSRDQRHEDRFNRRWELAPGIAQTLRIPLDEIRNAPKGRQMDLQSISGIVVFQTNASSSRQFTVQEVRLE